MSTVQSTVNVGLQPALRVNLNKTWTNYFYQKTLPACECSPFPVGPSPSHQDTAHQKTPPCWRSLHQRMPGKGGVEEASWWRTHCCLYVISHSFKSFLLSLAQLAKLDILADQSQLQCSAKRKVQNWLHHVKVV